MAIREDTENFKEQLNVLEKLNEVTRERIENENLMDSTLEDRVATLNKIKKSSKDNTELSGVQRDIEQEIKKHVKSGHAIMEARETVATKLGVAANTLWNWQSRLNLTTPLTTKITKVSNNTVMARKITVDPSIPRTKDHLSRVLTALVSKNGEFSTKEASAISQVSSNILGFNKHELEVAKFLNKNLMRTGK